jgi:hypothetical protein
MKTTVDTPLFVRFRSPGPSEATWTPFTTPNPDPHLDRVIDHYLRTHNLVSA